MTLRARFNHESLEEGVYRALFDSAYVGLTIVDGDRRILACNEAYCRIVGRPHDEVIGRQTPEFGMPGVDATGKLMGELVSGEIESYSAEKRYARPDGTTVLARVTTAPIGDGSGKYVGVVLDLSETEQAKAAAREQQALLERAQEVGGVGSWLWYPEEGRNIWSPHARRIYGLSDEQAETEDPALFFDNVHPDDRDAVAETSWNTVRTRGFVTNEYRFIRPSDGEVRWIHGQAIVDGNRVLGAVTDVTDAREAARALEQQAALLERAQSIGRVGVWTWYADTDTSEWSAEAQKIYGLPTARGPASLFWEVVHPDDRSWLILRMEDAFDNAEAVEVEHRIIVDGHVRWVRTRAEVALDENGRPARHRGVVIDLTSTREAQKELAEQKSLLERAEEVGGSGSWAWYAREDRNIWSAQALRILGLSDEDASDPNAEAFFAAIHPDDVPIRNQRTFLTALSPKTVEYRFIRKTDGAVRWIRETSVLEPGGDGESFRLLGALTDITEAKAAAEALAEQTEALGRAHELARLGRYTVDANERTILFSPEVARLLGVSSSDVLHDLETFRLRFVHEDDLEDWVRNAEACLSKPGEFAWDSRMRTGDGRVVWMRVRGRTEADELGRPVRAIGVVQDVTEQHALEGTLRQSQKLEAVGQLAAGVAHDFNNLLTVIIGNVDFALATGAPSEELREVLAAADRASELVRQLLAFSRAGGNEAIVVDVNEAVGELQKMIERVIEENIGVSVSLTGDETPVLIEPGQLEQVLLNLTMNARDAMRNGGSLAISTRIDGDDVVVDVTDTGHGMDGETRERVFDPFFTTKLPGEGTGLGLSTVYGIVTRTGGSIEVESEVDRGTTFRIRLPRAHGLTRRPAAAASAPASLATPAGGRVLVVEDDDMVRSVAAEALEQAGYEVVTTANGREALDAVEQDRDFDLVVTDLMMPLLTGVQLTAELEARGHGLPVIYTSGYPGGVTDEVPRGPRAEFLPKPFRSGELVSAVERLLGK